MKFHGSSDPDRIVDWPKEAEILAIEREILDLSQGIAGVKEPPNELWQRAHPFAKEIQKPYIREGYDQRDYDRAEGEYFRGIQMWCDHTDDYLDYLSAYSAQERPTISHPASSAPSDVLAVDYEVAISFAGEDRPVARQLADGLRDRGRRVFYDEYEEANLWGHDLYTHLSNVYKNRARFVIILISHAYRDKLWTKHELRSAQARAFSENKDYILPLRVDETEIDGVLPTTGYLHLRDHSIADVIEILEAKLNNA